MIELISLFSSYSQERDMQNADQVGFSQLVVIIRSRILTITYSISTGIIVLVVPTMFTVHNNGIRNM